ncbi:hypothetical protein BN439_3777 [Erwinia amylovora Ea644]|uniref:Uncharacterized protein n=1 Tax=Erwinia amylovora ATCC BAA-2158 TaxID=889211 RepID=E5BAA9_ERWAM|nr:hypothetical protein predicted by Glimmer/Critica [Erwinia amylovora ATCC BAA-2158]CCP04800.1 hypothetical protein BN439_3777 [Erwinia amylovora Ea644]CCP08870.1 hypothetical protein BN440_3885 [Erwinia amylovora MR1]
MKRSRLPVEQEMAATFSHSADRATTRIDAQTGWL